MPWFVKNYICEYCEQGFDTLKYLTDHVQAPEHIQKETQPTSEGRQLTKWRAMRDEHAKRHDFTPTTPTTVQNLQIVPGSSDGGDDDTSTPLLDELDNHHQSDNNLTVLMQLADELYPNNDTAGTVLSTPLVTMSPPHSVTTPEEPAPKRMRVESTLQWDTISTRTITEQNRFLAEALDEQSRQISGLVQTISKVCGTVENLSKEVALLRTCTEERFQKTRGYIRELGAEIREEFAGIRSRQTNVTSREINQQGRDKLLLSMIQLEHTSHNQSNTLLNCSVCQTTWARLNSILDTNN